MCSLEFAAGFLTAFLSVCAAVAFWAVVRMWYEEIEKAVPEQDRSINDD